MVVRRPFGSLRMTSFSSYPESHSGAKIGAQGGISNYLLIVPVQSVLNIYVRCNTGVHSVPASQIHSRVAGRVIDTKAKEV